MILYEDDFQIVSQNRIFLKYSMYNDIVQYKWPSDKI